MRLDFDRAEITEVIRTISDLTGKNFILPDNVRGRITILSPTMVSADQAYAAFLAALEANQLAVYQVGQFHKIVPKNQAQRSNIPTLIDEDATWALNEQMVTRLFRLEHVEADQVSNIANSFLSRDGDIQTFPPDILIITDVGVNLHRIERILRQLDQAGSGHDEIRIIQIRYASAPDIAQKLMEVFQQTGGTATPQRRATPASPAARRAQVRRQATQQQQETQEVEISRVLADERTNKIILIADQRSFERIEDLIAHLDVPTEGEGQVHVHYLMNANAEELASTLSQLTGARTAARTTATRGRAAQAGDASGDLFEGELRISADSGTNSLVIVSSFNDYRALRRVIEQLDIPRRQVFVEAVIMEVTADVAEELGLAFHGGGAPDIRGDQAPVLVGTQLGGLNSLSLASLLQFGGFLAGIQGPPIPGTEGLPISVPSFGVVLHALQRDSNVNVLSTPHILTSDNEEAEISVGQNVPFQAGFAPPGISNMMGGATGEGGADSLLRSFSGLGGLGNFYAPIQRQNVELRLRIRPQINESDYVRLEIDEQIEEIASVDRVLGPTTSRRTAKTTVVARDGQTIVLGGLMQERNVESISKVPVLGDVPVLGRLFRTSEVRTVKTNLLLFLTPYIIKDESDFRRIFERKLQERQTFLEQFYGMDNPDSLPTDFGRKVGPLGEIRRTLDEERLAPENDGPGRNVEVFRPSREIEEETVRPWGEADDQLDEEVDDDLDPDDAEDPEDAEEHFDDAEMSP